MVINTLDRDRHWVRETEQVRFLRRETGLEDLFTVYFPEEDTWSIAIWTNKARGEFRELKMLKWITDLDRQEVHDLMMFSRRQTRTPREIIKQTFEDRETENRRWYEEADEATECKKWLGKRLGRAFGNKVAENPEWNRPGLAFQV